MTADDTGSLKEPADFSNITTAPTVVYINTKQEVIVVTKDKLHLCLQGAMDRMGIRDRWMVPLGVLVPLALTLSTTSFDERFGVAGTGWATVFIMLTLFTVAWLGYTLIRRPRSVSISSLVEELAKNPVPLDTAKATAVIGSPLAEPAPAQQPTSASANHGKEGPAGSADVRHTQPNGNASDDIR